VNSNCGVRREKGQMNGKKELGSAVHYREAGANLSTFHRHSYALSK
jgi:hypothetical protein